MILMGPGHLFPDLQDQKIQICKLIALDLGNASSSCEVIEGIFYPTIDPAYPERRNPPNYPLLLAFRNNVQCIKTLYTLLIPFDRLPTRKATGGLMQFRSWRRRPCGQ